MNSDFLLSDEGDVVFVQDRPYLRPVVRAEFFAESGTLILFFDNEDSRMIECEISNERLIQAICEAPHITLSHVAGETLQDGHRVPIIAIR